MPAAAPPLSSSSLETWIEFLRAAIEARTVELPFGNRDAELHQALVNVHRSIGAPQTRHVYDDAIAAMLETYAATPHAVWELFTLLQLVAYAKPLKAKQLVRRVVVTEILLHHQYGGYDLHALALAAASKYSVDEFLLDYVDRSARGASDIRYLLTCFRVRAIANCDTAADMLLHLVGAAPDLAHLQMVVRELRGFTSLYGFRPLLNWYLTSQPIGIDDAPLWPNFEELVVRDLTGPPAAANSVGDPHRLALAVALLAGRGPLELSNYELIANARPANVDLIRATLEFIWQVQLGKGWRVYAFAPHEYEKIDDRPDDAVLLLRRGGGRVHISLKASRVAAETLLELEHSTQSKTSRMRAREHYDGVTHGR